MKSEHLSRYKNLKIKACLNTELTNLEKDFITIVETTLKKENPEKLYNILVPIDLSGFELSSDDKYFMADYEEKVKKEHELEAGSGTSLQLNAFKSKTQVLDPEEVLGNAAFIKPVIIIIIVVCTVLFLAGFFLDIFS